MNILAQATQPIEAAAAVTSESTAWLGSFPIGIAMYSALGAFLAVAIIFRKRLDKAADPSQVSSSQSSVWLLAVTTFIIGAIAGFVGTPAFAEWKSIQSQALVNATATAIALLGVPISIGAIALGEAAIAKFVNGKLPPKS